MVCLSVVVVIRNAPIFIRGNFVRIEIDKYQFCLLEEDVARALYEIALSKYALTIVLKA